LNLDEELVDYKHFIKESTIYQGYLSHVTFYQLKDLPGTTTFTISFNPVQAVISILFSKDISEIGSTCTLPVTIIESENIDILTGHLLQWFAVYQCVCVISLEVLIIHPVLWFS